MTKPDVAFSSIFNYINNPKAALIRKDSKTPEDRLIWEIANNNHSYNDFRSKYYHGESSMYQTAYSNLYDFDLVTEEDQMMKLSKTGNEVYLYSDFKKYINQPKIGKKAQRESNQNSGDNFRKYLPHIGVIIVILGILIAFTLYF